MCGIAGTFRPEAQDDLLSDLRAMVDAHLQSGVQGCGGQGRVAECVFPAGSTILDPTTANDAKVSAVRPQNITEAGCRVCGCGGLRNEHKTAAVS
jgi:hypothetical protein